MAAFAVALVLMLMRRSVPHRAHVLAGAATPSRLAYSKGEVMPQRSDCRHAAGATAMESFSRVHFTTAIL